MLLSRLSCFHSLEIVNFIAHPFPLSAGARAKSMCHVYQPYKNWQSRLCIHLAPLFSIHPNSFLTTFIFKKMHGELVESSDFGIRLLGFCVTYWLYALEHVIESLYFSFLVCKMGMIMMMIITTIVIIINGLEGCY